MFSIGIDAGYSSVKISVINDNNDPIVETYLPHRGRIRNTIVRALKALPDGCSPGRITHGAATGSASGLMTHAGLISHTNEIASLIEGAIHIHPSAGSIIEIGGQSAKYITGFTENDRSRTIVSINSNCSAGTGSFLEEQASRLNIGIEDYSILAANAKNLPRIAGRCSVFAKTDIIHHQQEGVPVGDILAGLAYALVKNYRSAVMKKNSLTLPVLFAGGVAFNRAIVTALLDTLGLNRDDLILPEHPANVAATGAAIIAKRNDTRVDVERLIRELESPAPMSARDDAGIALPELQSFGRHDSRNRHTLAPATARDTGCYLGIDIGSTSTNIVLTNDDCEIMDYQYIRTAGDPVGAVKKAFENVRNKYGTDIHIAGVCTTGSGRYMIGDIIGADLIKDEITAQAKAAVRIDPGVDTVFEIGGQDSKFIQIKNGAVTDFQMNKICAAGTGSFIEEQAKKFNIPIESFADVALQSRRPIYLGERCTVFIETSIAEHLSRGAKIEDIAAGLCYSIVRNYLDRVVGQKKPGTKIFFQGGVAHNQGVVNAFRAVTGKEIIVPPFFSVTGAYGAAILAKEEHMTGKSSFKGFTVSTPEKKKALPIFAPEDAGSFNSEVNRIIFQDYDAKCDKSKKTVGIPRALFTFGMFPMFNAFFKELGFNVLLSEPTSEETIRRGQEYSLDEACYPVKLINGHVAELVEKKVDYIFFPDLYTVDHPDSQSRKNYGCAYMQLAFKVVNQAMDLRRKGIQLLAPTIAFSLGREFMMKSFGALGEKLGRTPEETAHALRKGMEAFHDFENRVGESGKKILAGIGATEKVFVIISKIYGVADPALNMGIPEKLTSMGYRVLPFYVLPQGNAFAEHPNMFWPFGQHILEPAQLVKEHPNFYAILLTHHGCGPDSVLSHYFREIMGGKQFLHIEVDEHSSGVGVHTRIEAFMNSLSGNPTVPAGSIESCAGGIRHSPVNISTHIGDLKTCAEVFIPHLYPYSNIFRELLSAHGIAASVMPPTDSASLAAGRRHTIAEEYFSMTALLGDCFKLLESAENGKRIAFLVPQTEGAEVEGQYSRFLRLKFDEEGFGGAEIISPFLEDVLFLDGDAVDNAFLSLLAGDIVLSARRRHRGILLEMILDSIRDGTFGIDRLAAIAQALNGDDGGRNCGKTVLALGEVTVLYNDFLNDYILSALEDRGHRMLFSPLSEYMWLFWRDCLDQNRNNAGNGQLQKLDKFADYIGKIAKRCAQNRPTPFETNLHDLIGRADAATGYYAGANGRYRAAKITCGNPGIQGIITVASMYENTGISLGILQNGFAEGKLKPVLNLTFDGNKNENDETKVESFLYFLK